MAPIALSVAIAATTFWLAYDGGSSDIGSRATAAVAGLWLLALGLLTGVLPRERPPWPAALVIVGLGGYAIVAVSSIGWGAAPHDGLDELNRAALYLGAFALVVVASRKTGAVVWLDGLALGIAGTAALALASRLLPNLVTDTDYKALALLYPQGAARLSFPVGYWNGLATLSVLATPLLLRAATMHRRPVARGLAVFPFPIIACTLYLTSSRTGLVACAVGLLVYFVLSGRPSATIAIAALAAPASLASVWILTRHAVLVNGPFGSAAAVREGRVVAFAVLGISVGLAIVTGLLGHFASRLRPSAKAEQVTLAVGLAAAAAALIASHPIRLVQQFKAPPVVVNQTNYVQSHLMSANGSGRWQLWGTAAEEWRTRPLLGRGIGSYERWQIQHGKLGVYVRDAHSLYLQTLGELGVLGLACLVVAFGAGLAILPRVVRLPRKERAVPAAALAGVATFVAAAGADWVWQIPVVAVAALALLAVAISAIPYDQTRRDRPRLSWVSRGGVGLVVAACLALMVAQVIEAGSHRELRASQLAAGRGDLTGAFARARTAARVEPWAATPYLQLALVEEQRGHRGVARGWIREALDRDRGDWQLWAISARLAAEAGAISDARHSLAQARRLNPAVSGWGRR